MVLALRLGGFSCFSFLSAILLSQTVPTLPAAQKRQEDLVQNPVGPPGAQALLRGPVSLAGYGPADPAGTPPGVIPPSDFQLAPGQTEDLDLGLYLDFNNVENFQPIRGNGDSPTDLGPRNREYDKLNSDLFARPGTDSGDVAFRAVVQPS
jgi:hypothetical protein